MNKIILLLLLLLLLFLSGCQSTHENTEKSNQKGIKLRLLPEDYFYEEVCDVQINSVPMPFYLVHTYVVWVNGKRIKLNHAEIRALCQSLNLPLQPAPDTEKFHNGGGWLEPLKLADNE